MDNGLSVGSAHLRVLSAHVVQYVWMLVEEQICILHRPKRISILPQRIRARASYTDHGCTARGSDQEGCTTTFVSPHRRFKGGPYVEVSSSR